MTTDNNQLDIVVTLSEADIRKALAAYIANELGDTFVVPPSGIEFKLEKKYEDRPGGSSTTVFKEVTAKASKRKPRSGGGMIM